MNRRQMIKHTGLTIGAVGVAGPAVLLQTSCAPKNLSVYVQTVVATLKEISPLLPSSAQLIARAVSIAEDFDRAYRDGKFENATALFENLAGLISQIASDVGVDTPQIKVALAVVGISIRAIALLLRDQAQNLAVAEVVERQKSSTSGKAQISLIERLANPAVIDQAFVAVKL